MADEATDLESESVGQGKCLKKVSIGLGDCEFGEDTDRGAGLVGLRPGPCIEGSHRGREKEEVDDSTDSA